MKKLLCVFLILALTAGLAGAAALAEEDGAGAEPVDGGWVQAEDRSITPERRAIFESAFAGDERAVYEPVEYLMYQVVGGMNHCFMARRTDVPGPADVWAVVYIYEDEYGFAKVYDTAELNPPSDPAAPEPADDPVQLPAGEEPPAAPDPSDEPSGEPAPFAYADGFIAGTYEPENEDDFVEIKVNNQGAGAGFGPVRIRVPASEPGDYIVEVFVNGTSSYTLEIAVPELPSPTESPAPSEPPVEEPVYQFTLTAGEGGSIPAGLDTVISGPYKAGDTISILAREMPGYRFAGWISSAGGEFEDVSSSTTTFTMPANDVTVTARFEPVEPIETITPEEPPVVTLAEDGSSAQVTGDYDGLYVRIAFVLELNGESGLYVTQGLINTDGSIVIPRFEVRGLTVKGVNVALVQSLDDITSPKPEVIASASIRL